MSRTYRLDPDRMMSTPRPRRVYDPAGLDYFPQETALAVPITRRAWTNSPVLVNASDRELTDLIENLTTLNAAPK
jgi:hypothetical protein